MFSSMHRSSTRSVVGTTFSSNMNSSSKVMESTGAGRSTHLFNQSICSNATSMTATDLCRSTSVMCLVKGRGKAATETGIASMDLRRNILRMSQFCDDQLFSQLMTQVHMINPAEIVVACTLKESSLLDDMFEKLNRNFPASKVQGVPRRYMNEIKGREFVKALCSRDSSGVDVALHSKVYALLAVSGLLNYVEECLSMYLAPHTLRMVYHSGANCMLMDHGTAVNLELLKSTAASGGNLPCQSLYNVINHTNTLTGGLTLRSNLLEPPTEHNLIEARYDAVEELTEDVELFSSLQSLLKRFPDIERVISLAIQIPRHESRCSAEAKIRNCLCLKTSIELVPCIAEVLRSAKSTLIKNFRQKLMNNGLERILQLLMDKLNSNATINAGTSNIKRQLVFAVKTGLDGKLDAMREVYNSLIDQTEEMLQFLAETYQLAVRLAYTQQRGFHCTIKIPRSGETPNIPAEFIKVCKGRGMYSMTTDKLVILNARISECMDSIYNLSNRVVTQLLSDIHKEIPCLNSLVHAIGHLDMLTALASVSRQPEYIRPQLGDMLAIKKAKHPVADVTANQPVVPNDIYVTPESNFMIITGANNSGKSFYLRTIAVLQVMAQIGCFVPASFAMIRVCDQIFSRIGSDNSTCNMESSFTIEMKEVAFVLKHKTPTALIILDELCRGTSSHEAVDICFTICRQLLQISAFTLFATHYKELCQLESTYSNCVNFCFVTKYEDVDTDSMAKKIVNDHKLRRGIAKGSRYGLRLAATMNFPKSIITHAYSIADRIDGGFSESVDDSLSQSLTSSVRDDGDKLINKVYDEIALIARHGTSSTDKVLLLKSLREKYGGQLKQLLSQKGQLETTYQEDHNMMEELPPPPLKEFVAQRFVGIETPSVSNDSKRSALPTMTDKRRKPNVHSHPASLKSHSATTEPSSFSMLSLESKRETGHGSSLSHCSNEATCWNRLSNSPSQDVVRSFPSNKLVNYSISPIDLSGTIKYHPHSDITAPATQMYRTSTRKSRDPQSPLRSLYSLSSSQKGLDIGEDSDTPYNFDAPASDEKSFYGNNSLEGVVYAANNKRVCRKNGLETFDVNVESDAGLTFRENFCSIDEFESPQHHLSQVSPASSVAANNHYHSSILASVETFHGLPSESSTLRNQSTNVDSLSATIQTISSRRSETEGNSIDNAELKSKSSDKTHCSVVLNKPHFSPSIDGLASKHQYSKSNEASICYRIDEIKDGNLVVDNDEREDINITNISPILGSPKGLKTDSDLSIGESMIMPTACGRKTTPMALSIADRVSHECTEQNKVPAVLNKTMWTKRVREDGQNHSKLSSSTERASLASSNATAGSELCHSDASPMLDSTGSNKSGSKNLSASGSNRHSHKLPSISENKVITGSLSVTAFSEAGESHCSKAKSVTFGNEEIIPHAADGECVYRSRKQKLEISTGKSVSILRTSNVACKGLVPTAQNDLIYAAGSKDSESTSRRNKNRMELLDELLRANQTPQEQRGCFSSVKIEPK